MKKLFTFTFILLALSIFTFTPGISLAAGGPPGWTEQDAGKARWYKKDWEEERHGVLHDCSALIIWYPVKSSSYWCHPIVVAGETEPTTANGNPTININQSHKFPSVK